MPSERCDEASLWGKERLLGESMSNQQRTVALKTLSCSKGRCRFIDCQARRGTGFVQESELPPDDGEELWPAEWPWVLLEFSEGANAFQHL